MVAFLLWVQEVGSSNLLSPTTCGDLIAEVIDQWSLWPKRSAMSTATTNATTNGTSFGS